MKCEHHREVSASVSPSRATSSGMTSLKRGLDFAPMIRGTVRREGGEGGRGG